MTVLVGREAALGTLLDSVDELRHDRPRAAVVVAPPGLGKSALLAAFAAAVAARDVRTLTARPLELESGLAFSGLAELLAALPPEEYDALPTPQRQAIRAALLLDDAGVAEPRAVGAGVAGVLTGLVEHRPLVVVIDDAHWLDAASAGALALGLRRVQEGPVLVVAAARPTGRPIGEWLPDWPHSDVDLTALSMSATYHVVREHLGVILDRGQLRAVHRASEGNPLHALEFARHRLIGPDASFEALLADRVLALPRPTRRALLAAALASAPSISLVAAALEATPEETLDLLEPAVTGRLVRVGDRVRFLHPLYLEAAVDAAAHEERTALHLRLADLEPLPEVRVRHQAEASDAPDPVLAERLDASARRVWDRAGWAAAIDLMRRAVDRTPAAEPVGLDRRLRLARWLATNGSPEEARDLLRDVREEAVGETYLEATMELAALYWLLGQPISASVLVDRLREADLPVHLRARMLFRLDNHVLAGDPAVDRHRAIADLTEVNALLRDEPDRPGLARLRAKGLSLEAALRWDECEDASALLAEALDLDAREPAARVHDGPQSGRCWELVAAGRHDQAREVSERMYRRAVDEGDDQALPEVLLQWGYLEEQAGRWGVADDRYAEALRVAEAMHQAPYLARAYRAYRAGLAGLRGDLDGSMAALGPLEPQGAALDYPIYAAIWWQLVGQVRCAFGQAVDGYAALCSSWAACRRAGSTDPLRVSDALLVEAAVAVGRLEEAEAHFADAEDRVARSGRSVRTAELGRARVALLGARGRLEEAVAEVPGMLAAFDGPHRPLELAKARLTAGMLLRRRGAKRLADEQLGLAVAGFEGLGCAPYAARAREERRRVGLRPRASSGLTEGELRVARLAAEGLRNAEIAAAAYVSPKTVESTLTRCYRKLGIRSRAELARALVELDAGGLDPERH